DAVAAPPARPEPRQVVDDLPQSEDGLRHHLDRRLFVVEADDLGGPDEPRPLALGLRSLGPALDGPIPRGPVVTGRHGRRLPTRYPRPHGRPHEGPPPRETGRPAARLSGPRPDTNRPGPPAPPARGRCRPESRGPCRSIAASPPHGAVSAARS